jgi:hypothetical protein
MIAIIMKQVSYFKINNFYIMLPRILSLQNISSSISQLVITRNEWNYAASPVALNGLEPGAEYHVYVVITDGQDVAAKTLIGQVAVSLKPEKRQEIQHRHM